MVEVAGPLDVPGGTGIAEAAAAHYTGAVERPDRRLAIVVLPQDVGFAVAVEIPGPDDVPARPGIAEAGAGDGGRPVGLPHRRLAAVVLPEKIGPAVAIDVARRLGMPA